jgi:hypothetical protein
MTFPRSAVLLLINAVAILAIVLIMARVTDAIDIDNKDLIIITSTIGGISTLLIMIEAGWASANTKRDDGRPNVMESQGNERGEGY